jgi:hypothetical protein
LYTFDWGDGSTTVTDLVPSGTSAGASHAWTKAGTYNIRAAAIDRKGAASEWSSGLSATVATNKPPDPPGKPGGGGQGCCRIILYLHCRGKRSRWRSREVHLRLGRWNLLRYDLSSIRQGCKCISHLENGRNLPGESNDNRQQRCLLRVVKCPGCDCKIKISLSA